jgi:signal transduction histidine kinase
MDARRRFVTTFIAGTFFALLAGGCLLALTVKSELLSRHRARFAAAAAHELRSPLATIRLHSEMLAENLGRHDLAKEYASRVADEVERLGRVVTNALGYARMERGNLTVYPEVGDLAGTVREIIGRMSSTVELEIREPLPPVSFDPDALQHVVQNLVDNAEKFSRLAEDRTIQVTLEEDGDEVALSVTDHGPGVPPAARRKLFKPYSYEAGRGANQGLGLGLVLVHALVTAMGGRIRYEDVSGGGARFTVSFPAGEPLLLDTPDR